MFFSSSQTWDRKSSEMPMMVRLMPSSQEAFSRKFFQPERLLSQTSVSMMILFSWWWRLFFLTYPISSSLDSLNPAWMVVPPRVLIASSCWYTFSPIQLFRVGGKTTSALLSNMTSPTESSGRSLPMNILMASIERLSLDSLAEPESPLLMEPEMSRQRRALMGVASRSAPSLLLLTNMARQSLMVGSALLLANWCLAYPKCRSTILSVLGPIPNLISLKTPSQVRWLTSGKLPYWTA